LIKRLLTKVGIVGLAGILTLTPFIPIHEVSADVTCVEEAGWVCIDTEYELQHMSLSGKNKLAIDISLTSAWTPIGDSTTHFTGVFDGNGHIISNMQITSTASYVGFFGLVDGATIRNIRLINVSIDNSGGSDHVGGIAGRIEANTLIENSSVTGTVKAVSTDPQTSQNVGGLVGNADSSSIVNSSFYGTVEGDIAVGGLLGYGVFTVVNNSFAFGKTRGIENIGGLVGHTQGNNNILNSLAAVEVDILGGSGSGNGFHGKNDSNLTNYNFNFWNNDLFLSGTGAVGKSTDELKKAGTYSSWPQSNAWKIVENASYPVQAELFDEISPNSLTVKGVTAGPDHEIEIDYEEGNGYYEIPVAYNVDSIELSFKHSTTSGITVASKSATSGSEMLDNHYPEYTSSPTGWDTTTPTTVNGASATSDSTVTIPIEDTLSFVQIIVTAQGDGPESVYKLTITRDEGSSTYPHRISTAGELAKIGIDGYDLNDHYTLINDIDLLEYPGYSNWTPIGDFSGEFNGNNHVIDHLTITQTVYDRIGLFSEISVGGIVSNLHLRGVKVTGDEHVGGLAGWNSGTVSYSSVVGEVTGNDRVGGLVGTNDGGLIERSYATGEVTGSSHTGGLAGHLTALSTVNDSYAAAKVTPVNPGTNIGGLSGSHEDGATINHSYWDMSLFQTSPVGVGLDTADMMRISSFSDWDFSTDWGIIENTTYPMYRIGYDQVLLNSISVDGNLLSGFTNGQGSYTIIRDNKSPVTVTPVTAILNSVVSIDGNNVIEEGSNEIKIKVLSANGAWTGLYKLHIFVDTKNPVIATTLDPDVATAGSVDVGVVVDGTGTNVVMVKWAEGVRDSAYFVASGTTIAGPPYGFTVGAIGTYTVYARDEAGNKTVQTVAVSNIVTEQPSITLTYNPAPTNGTVKVSMTTVVHGENEGNSIDKRLWAPGIQNEAYFATSGTEITDNSFDAASNGIYTVYVHDKAGNEAVQMVTVSNIVTEQPSIILTYSPSLTKGPVEVSVTTVVYSVSEGNIIEVLRWAPGSLDATYFAGSEGTDIDDGQFTVSENGMVTVYARDRAGFETVERVDVNWIVNQAPSITHDYEGAASGQVSIDITVAAIVNRIDAGNTLDVLKWAKGSYTLPDFTGGTVGEDITSDSKFTVTTNGIYTLYARDIFGNETVLAFTVNKVYVPFSSSSSTSGSSNAYSGPACEAEHCISLAPGEAKQFEVEGLTLTIPANATSTSMTVKLKNITSQFLTEKRLLGQVYEITKSVEGLFLKPVTLEFRFDPVALEENSTPAVFYYDEEEDVWIELDNTIVTGNNTVRGETNHFTKFAVLAIEKAKPISEQPVVSFSDINRHWANSFIERAVLEGFVSGYTDGNFWPNRTVTRAEFTVMLAKALHLVSDGETAFRDTAAIPAWARQSVTAVVASGIVSGYDDGTFRPQGAMIRTEAAVIAVRAVGLQALIEAETPFADNAAIPTWAKRYVAVAYESGLIVGKNGNRFAAQDSLTRAEAVVILLGILDRISE
jgi:hypothetical protein